MEERNNQSLTPDELAKLLLKTLEYGVKHDNQIKAMREDLIKLDSKLDRKFELVLLLSMAFLIIYIVSRLWDDVGQQVISFSVGVILTLLTGIFISTLFSAFPGLRKFAKKWGLRKAD